MPFPYFAWELLATLMAPLPIRPISRDQNHPDETRQCRWFTGIGFL
jgi:hypothetical protein